VDTIAWVEMKFSTPFFVAFYDLTRCGRLRLQPLVNARWTEVLTRIPIFYGASLGTKIKVGHLKMTRLIFFVVGP
jgi:hypothetical protein